MRSNFPTSNEIVFGIERLWVYGEKKLTKKRERFTIDEKIEVG